LKIFLFVNFSVIGTSTRHAKLQLSIMRTYYYSSYTLRS